MSTLTYLWPNPDLGGEGHEGADTYLDASAQTSNFSTETKIKVGITGLGGRYLGLIRFALPNGPPFIGTDYLWSATLRLKVVLNEPFPLDVWHLEKVWNATEACYCYCATSGSNQNWVDGGTNCDPPTNEGVNPTVTGPIGSGVWNGSLENPGGQIDIPLTVEPGSTVWDLVMGGLLLAFRPYTGLSPDEALQIESWEMAGYTLAPELDIVHDPSPPPWYVPSGVGWKAGSRKFRFSPCGGYYPCCGYYYCYGNYYCCPCYYFSYGGLAPCCQHAELSGFTGDAEFLNRTWRLAQCTVPTDECPPCTWRAAYCTPTGDEETRYITLRIWNDGMPEAPAYKARLTVEGSTFEKDLGATKPNILDVLGELARTGGNEGAASVAAELEDGDCGETVICPECRCGLAPKQWLVEISGIVDGGSCTDCARLNGGFILEANCGPREIWGCSAGPGEPALCYWCYAFSAPAVCSGEIEHFEYGISLCVMPSDPLHLEILDKLLVRSVGNVLYEVFRFSKTFNGGVPCRTLNEENLPLESSGEGGCDASIATCTVTAL